MVAHNNSLENFMLFATSVFFALQAGVPDDDRAALLGLALSAITKQRSLAGGLVELCALLRLRFSTKNLAAASGSVCGGGCQPRRAETCC